MRVGLGLIWAGVFRTSCFEGYCGMLVFLTFMPIGIVLGGVIGALTLGYFGARDPTDVQRSARIEATPSRQTEHGRCHSEQSVRRLFH